MRTEERIPSITIGQITAYIYTYHAHGLQIQVRFHHRLCAL